MTSALLDPTTARLKRETFFKLLFGRGNGFVCVAMLSAGTRKLTEHFFRFPDELDEMLRTIEANVQGQNVYFCPQILSERKRVKETIADTPNLWADLDTCNPSTMLIEPSVAVETSPNRFQAYWIVDSVDPDDAEATSKKIAYAHAAEGADRSGWDLTQLLRVPYTYNYKYQTGAGLPVVHILNAGNVRYKLQDFSLYPEVDGYEIIDIPMPLNDELPKVSAEELLQERRNQINPLVWKHFTEEPLHDWSKTLWQLQMLLFEAGFNREEVFVIARDAKCNKYARDGRPLVLLWKDTCRAANQAEENAKILGQVGNVEDLNLLTEEEKNLLDSAPATFVDRYHEWAKSLGDAAPQYHIAGGFFILSTLLSGSIKLPTSFGTIIPNLWFMILADTTLTRKSTAMDLAMDTVTAIDEDALLATDGSLEGMITSLAARNARPSVFLRDEFSGLLEAITRKDYMAGFAETLTKLYDGKPMKRLLRKEVVEVRNPILILFAGGIKDKICSLLTFEHVSSGFMPRFIFITAESDPTRVQPLGPPTEKTDNGKANILDELQIMAKHYHQSVQMELPKGIGNFMTRRMWDATLTSEAWTRYNRLEAQMVQDGLDSERPEIMTPVNDRLSKSILKAAVLLAASRQAGEDVVVEEIDVLQAIRHGVSWKSHANIVMASVGKGALEKQIDSILKLVEHRPGVTRSVVMQWLHLTAQQANALFDTMDQRGLVIRRKQGRSERLWPVVTTLKGSKKK